MIESEARRQENNNKLKLLDALDAYPKATQQAVRLLNSLLSQRAPKDPPPPRRSKRKTDEESTEPAQSPAKKKKGDKQTKESGALDGMEQVGRISSAATQASLSQAETLLSKPPDGTLEKAEGTKTKKKRELHVGGWVSPIFSATVDRSWLEKDSPHKSFDLKTFAPQPGDTVL